MPHLPKELFLVVLCTVLAAGQQTHSAPASPASTPHHTAKAADAAHLPSEDTVNAFLRQTFGYEPGLSWKITNIRPAEAQGLVEVDVTLSSAQGSQGQKFYVTPDGTHAVVGEILPFGAQPYDAARKKLEKDLNGPAHGPADAAVTVVEFSDLQCPHCKDAQPTMERLMAEDKKTRVVFQNFPLPMHDWALKAAGYADCVGRQSPEAFWKFISSVYTAQTEITAANADEKLTGFADSAGVKGSEVAACSAKPETTTRIEHSVELGKSLDVNSTPTIFVNGRKLSAGGLPYEVLQKLVDFAAQEAKH